MSSKLVIRFECSKRTIWFLMCFEAVLSLKIQIKTDFSQKCFSKEGVGGNEEGGVTSIKQPFCIPIA